MLRTARLKKWATRQHQRTEVLVNVVTNSVILCPFILKANLHICDPLSENLHSFHNFNFFFKFSQHYLQCLRSGYLKFQLNQASNFEVIALDSRMSKKINLHSNHTENKLQALTFAAITLLCICLQCWDLA